MGWELVPGLRVEAVPGASSPTLHVSGSLMESARVFSGVDVVAQDGRIGVVVRSRLLDDRYPGSPDFDVEVPVDVPAGHYEVVYGSGDDARPLGDVTV